MRELTGFRIKKLAATSGLARPTATGKRLGLQQQWGVAQPIEPLFAAADATAGETLATYPDGSAAVALRDTADGPSLFVGPPGFDGRLLASQPARPAYISLRRPIAMFTPTDPTWCCMLREAAPSRSTPDGPAPFGSCSRAM